jgi:nucleoside-diphosphate-sugar epimerase
VRALRAAGHEVRTEFVDVRDLEALGRAVEGCDAVCHVAALCSYTAAAAVLEAVNVLGTANVVEACRRAGVARLVHTSTRRRSRSHGFRPGSRPRRRTELGYGPGPVEPALARAVTEALARRSSDG